MPNFIIREIDETVPSAAISDTNDIAFVPGIADTNNNCYIVSDASGAAPSVVGSPAKKTEDNQYTYDYNTVPEQYPAYYINTAVKKEWARTEEGRWEAVEYIAPAPENAPVICYSLSDFEKNFGEKPYQWLSAQKYPIFESQAKVNGLNMYEAEDFERSYIIARELIGRGMPVMYINFVTRNTDGRKQVPTVSDIYAGIKKCFTEPDYTDADFSDEDMYVGDRGTFNVKYLTSGAYPTFELLGGAGVGDTVTHTAKDGDDKKIQLVAVATKDSVTKVTIKSGDSDAVETTNFSVDADSVLTVSDTIKADDVITVEYTYATPDFTGITKAMLDTAEARGDAVAIIDHANAPARQLYSKTKEGAAVIKTSVYASMNSRDYTNGKYGAMFTPWGFYDTLREREGVTVRQLLPASFGYLNALAQSIKANDPWLAIAGVVRGYVPQLVALNTVATLSNTIADLYQPKKGISINAITNVRPYGLTIYANRTLMDNQYGLAALSNLNIRNLVSDIKKIVYTTAKSLVFEQNTEMLWINFKAGITPLLDRMLTGQGIESYKIIREKSDTKEQVKATIKIVPIRPVEDFSIDIVLTDSTVEVSAS